MKNLDSEIKLEDISILSNEFALSDGINQVLLDTLNESNNLLDGTDYQSRYSVLLQQPGIQGLNYDLFCNEFLKCADRIQKMNIFTPGEIVQALSDLGTRLKEKKK